MAQGDLLKPNVHGQLGRLKLKIRSRLAGEGLAWIILAVVAAVFVTLALDYMLHLEIALRGLLMVAAVAGLGYVVWRQMLLPLKVTMNDEDLALLVEKRYDKLGDRLISALQFGKATNIPPGTSEAMIEKVAIEANAIAEQLAFENVVERQNLKRMSLLALCAVVLLFGFGTWQSSTMGLWFKRNILFMNEPWPQRTYLTVMNVPNRNDFTVLRGDDLTVLVTVAEGSREIPPFIVLHADYPSVGATEERLDLMPDGRSYEKTFQSVSEPFSFYVFGGDDRRDKARPHQVTLIDPPSLSSVKYSIAYPQYMGRPDSQYDDVKGVMTIPLGSTVTFQCESTKALASAKMLLDNQEAGTARVNVSGDKKNLVGQVSITGTNKLSQKMLRFALTDTDGYSNRRGQQFMVQVQPDLPPTVEVKTHGIGANVTPNALLPFGVQVRDDIGVSSVQAGLTQVRKAATQSSQPMSMPTTVATTQTSRDWGVMTSVLPNPDGRKDFTADAKTALDLSTLKTRPNPGDVVAIVVEAQDNMYSGLGGPNKKSATVELKIVTPMEIQVDLTRRQMEIALEFAQALLSQGTSMEKTKAAAAAMGGGAPDFNTCRMHLQESASGQIAVATQAAVAAGQMQAIWEEMTNNRVFTAYEHKDVQNIVTSLQNLAKPIETVTGTLNQTLELVKDGKGDAQKVQETLNAAAEAQNRLLQELTNIHNDMLKSSNRGELINQVMALQKLWDQAMKETERLRKIEADRLLGTSKPTTAPATAPEAN